MRTIKFRGFNRKNNVWNYGFYLQNRGAHFVCSDEFDTGSWDDYEIDPETVGQFTGLSDKNDKEIYEGDILRLKEPNGCYSTCHVEMCKKGYWAISHGINEMVILGFVNHEQIEVIGNIYDNPELMK